MPIFGPIFAARQPMTFEQLRDVAVDLQGKLRITPPERADFRAGRIRRLLDRAAL